MTKKIADWWRRAGTEPDIAAIILQRKAAFYALAGPGHKHGVGDDPRDEELALLGIDHEKLTYQYNGRNFRLTDVAGDVVKEVIA